MPKDVTARKRVALRNIVSVSTRESSAISTANAVTVQMHLPDDILILFISLHTASTILQFRSKGLNTFCSGVG